MTRRYTTTLLSVLLSIVIATIAFAQAVYVPSRITELTGGRLVRPSGLVDRPGYFGNQILPDKFFPASTTCLSANYRVAHGVNVNCTGLRLVYINSTYQPGITTNANSIYTLKASVEVNSVNYPVTFRGQRSITMEPYAFVVSDPVPVTVLASYSQIYSRTYVSVAVAGTNVWPQTNNATNSNNCSFHNDTTAVDQTGSTGAMDNARVSGDNTYVYCPAMIVAKKLNSSQSTDPMIAVIGDSIASGNADTPSSGFVQGWCERGLLGQTILQWRM